MAILQNIKTSAAISSAPNAKVVARTSDKRSESTAKENALKMLAGIEAAAQKGNYAALFKISMKQVGPITRILGKKKYQMMISSAIPGMGTTRYLYVNWADFTKKKKDPPLVEGAADLLSQELGSKFMNSKGYKITWADV